MLRCASCPHTVPETISFLFSCSCSRNSCVSDASVRAMDRAVLARRVSIEWTAEIKDSSKIIAFNMPLPVDYFHICGQALALSVKDKGNVPRSWSLITIIVHLSHRTHVIFEMVLWRYWSHVHCRNKALASRNVRGTSIEPLQSTDHLPSSSFKRAFSFTIRMYKSFAVSSLAARKSGTHQESWYGKKLPC